MEFKSKYNTMTKDMPSTPSGEKIVLEHREEITKEGKRVLIRDRKVNIYEKIQASREQCDIENIIRRATEGDIGALQRAIGNYVDITDAPSSLAEAQQFVIRAKSEFEKLPIEIKRKFENNAEMYVAEYGTEAWISKTGLDIKLKTAEDQKAKEAAFNANVEKAFENLAAKEGLTNE